MAQGFGSLRVLAGVLSVLLSGCFIGYDSRWGQQKQAQRNVAAARMPTRLGASDAASAQGLSHRSRTLRVRIEPTATHAAQVVDYERHFQGMLDVANGVLETSLGIHLEVVDARAFRPTTGEDHIEALLEELRRADVGDDVDWVIGLAGAVPRFEDSFHKLGVGDVVGKHVVLRALDNTAEYQAIQEGFTELSDAERDKLARSRLEHKRAVVLLHELGHTCGALHELDKTSIMNSRYSKSSQNFGSQTLEVMRTVLTRRTRSGELDADGQQAVLELLRREPAPWVPAERDAALARLGVTTAAPSPKVPAVPAIGSTPGLAAADHLVFQEATRRLERGDADGALAAGKPLFATYPNVAAVMELRCNIALRRGGAYERIREECAGLMPGFGEAR